jgi:Uma2 family endonuclease
MERAMTALARPAHRPLTVADYLAMGEDDQHRTELQEGNLVMAASATPRHMMAIGRLHARIEAQLPPTLVAVPDVDLDLELAPPDGPGTCRRPDLVVVPRAEYDRVGREGGVLRATAAVLVVEILSPGSQRMDRIVKHGEYADAGVPHYWILDLEPPASLVACHPAGEFRYRDSAEAIGSFVATEPFAVNLDLDGLC